MKLFAMKLEVKFEINHNTNQAEKVISLIYA